MDPVGRGEAAEAREDRGEPRQEADALLGPGVQQSLRHFGGQQPAGRLGRRRGGSAVLLVAPAGVPEQGGNSKTYKFFLRDLLGHFWTLFDSCSILFNWTLGQFLGLIFG